MEVRCPLYDALPLLTSDVRRRQWNFSFFCKNSDIMMFAALNISSHQDVFQSVHSPTLGGARGNKCLYGRRHCAHLHVIACSTFYVPLQQFFSVYFYFFGSCFIIGNSLAKSFTSLECPILLFSFALFSLEFSS